MRDPGAALREVCEERQINGLRCIVTEFRHRWAEFFAGASELTALKEALASGRWQFGRLFHASLFLYQKLRLVSGELILEPLDDMPFYLRPSKLRSLTRAKVRRPERKGGEQIVA